MKRAGNNRCWGICKGPQQYASFAAVFQAGKWGEIAGLYHDIGKYSDGFLKGSMKGSKVDHSTAGAIEVRNKYQGISLPLAFCIAGHHGGLPNLGTQIAVAGDGTLNGRLKKELARCLGLSGLCKRGHNGLAAA